MPTIQHKDARKLLRLISSAVENKTLLTYKQGAKLLGRIPPENHSRAVAQMCDLLDAAATLAGVPMLALVAVREESGEINSNAWKKEYGIRRDAIIKRSLDYQFSRADFDAISDAINDLGHRGNRKAWEYVNGLYPGDLLYRRITRTYSDITSNAIDDLGTDAPDRAKSEVWTYARDPKVRDAVILRAKGKCEFCGQLGFIKRDGSRYLECHHIIALANDGEDRLTNVIALCPNDHREAHFGEKGKELERQMVQKVMVINNSRAHA